MCPARSAPPRGLALPCRLSPTLPRRCGSALPAPSRCRCPARPATAPVLAPPARYWPSARAPVRMKGRRRRLRFLARFFHLAVAAGSARRRLKATAPYNVNPAVESAWEHEPSLSSHDAAALLSLSSELGDFAKLPLRDDGQHARCTCPKVRSS